MSPDLSRYVAPNHSSTTALPPSAPPITQNSTEATSQFTDTSITKPLAGLTLDMNATTGEEHHSRQDDASRLATSDGESNSRDHQQKPYEMAERATI